MQNRSLESGQRLNGKWKMKTAEWRCGETKGVEERTLTEQRMIKCSHKQANMFGGRRPGGQAARQPGGRVRSQEPVTWTERTEYFPHAERPKQQLFPLYFIMKWNFTLLPLLGN